MKILLPLLFVFGLAACSNSGSQTSGTESEIKQYSSIEQQRCPSARFNSVHKRLECKQRVREELNQQKTGE
jgi:hypothetical protein